MLFRSARFGTEIPQEKRWHWPINNCRISNVAITLRRDDCRQNMAVIDWPMLSRLILAHQPRQWGLWPVSGKKFGDRLPHVGDGNGAIAIVQMLAVVDADGSEDGREKVWDADGVRDDFL